MLKFIKRKLGILSLMTRVEYLEKDIVRLYKSENEGEAKTRRTGRALRQDEVNRARKRRYKGA